MKELFCTKCVALTPHTGAVDQNGEYLFTCQTKDCGHFVKFPQVESKDELIALIEAHEEINRPVAEQVQAHTEQQNILTEVLEDGTALTLSGDEE